MNLFGLISTFQVCIHDWIGLPSVKYSVEKLRDAISEAYTAHTFYVAITVIRLVEQLCWQCKIRKLILTNNLYLVEELRDAISEAFTTHNFYEAITDV